MKTIFADYNAATESGHLRLTFDASQKAIANAHLHPGDWAWLSDGEVVVGAQLKVDEKYGLVGVPDWETIVHLDDEQPKDVDQIKAEVASLLIKEPPSIEDEPRVFQLLSQMDLLAPTIDDDAPGFLALRRALALRSMNCLGLALSEMKEACRARPNDSQFTFVYLDLLRREDPVAAFDEAERIAAMPAVSALILSACINILAVQAEQASEDQLEKRAQRLFALCRRFDQAPDLDQAGESLVALSYFNRGIVLLRSGRALEAREALENAQRIYPEVPMRDQLARLETYDHHAREVARSVRAIAERWSPTMTVAA
jgi:tetratricopeptide (TPR) repeat protein